MQFTAVDPLSTVLSLDDYLKITEMKHPNVPPDVAAKLRALPADQKKVIATNAQNMVTYYNSVHAAVGG